MADNEQATGQEGAAQEQQFGLQRIYVKDVSFETPMGAAAFTKQWQPQIHMDLNTKNTQLDAQNHEVVLTLTITAKLEEETAFLIEVQQAGIFMCQGIDDESMKQVLGAVCPNILFPYARETVDSLVVKGSFPPLMLAPVNFDAMFMQAQQEQQQQAH